MRSLAGPIPVDATTDGMSRIAFLLIALFAEMERTFAGERAAHARAVAEAKGRHLCRPIAHPAGQIEYAQLVTTAWHPGYGRLCAHSGWLTR